MKGETHMTHRITRFAFAALFFSLTLTPSAFAAREAALEGRWVGFFESSDNLAVVGHAGMEISTDKHARIKVHFFWDREGSHQVFDGDATLSANNNFDFTAVSLDGKVHFDAHGKIVNKNPLPGEQISIQVGAFKWDYHEQKCEHKGDLLFVHLDGGRDWNNLPAVQDVNGAWDGTYQSSVGPGGGCIEMDLQQQGGSINANGGPLTTAFVGTMHMDNVYLPAVQSFLDVNFNVLGTVGQPPPEPENGAPFGLIGLQPPPEPDKQGIIAILIGLSTPPDPENPASIQASYALFGSFTDVFNAIWTGDDASNSFDMGSCALNPQPFPP